MLSRYDKFDFFPLTATNDSINHHSPSTAKHFYSMHLIFILMNNKALFGQTIMVVSHAHPPWHFSLMACFMCVSPNGAVHAGSWPDAMAQLAEKGGPFTATTFNHWKEVFMAALVITVFALSVGSRHTSHWLRIRLFDCERSGKHIQ